MKSLEVTRYLSLQQITDNSAGNAPNAISSGLPAAHNLDGLD